MPNKDDILRDATFKGVVESIQERVFQTLVFQAGGKEPLANGIQPYRTQKLLAGLIEKLHDQSILNDEEIDELFSIVS